MKGVIFIVSSPTGAGKTTLCNIIQKERNDIERVITHTTRKPREGEINGIDYHFVNAETFKNMIKNGEFVEYAFVHNNYYGTSKKALNDVIEKGKNPILAIDVQGAKNIMNWIDRVVSIFILPPSFDEWLNRLEEDKNRDNLHIRLNTAINEFKEIEKFDYCIINDDLNKAIEDLKKIIDITTLKIKFFKDRFIDMSNYLKKKTKEYLEG